MAKTELQENQNMEARGPGPNTRHRVCEENSSKSKLASLGLSETIPNLAWGGQIPLQEPKGQKLACDGNSPMAPPHSDFHWAPSGHR